MAKNLKKTVSQILVKWNMPTRQIAINEIIEAVKDACIDTLPQYGFDSKKSVDIQTFAGYDNVWMECIEQSIKNIRKL